MSLIDLSCTLLQCARNGTCVEDAKYQLASVSSKKLIESLIKDNEKKAFWINVYNAFVLIEFRASAEIDYRTPLVHFKDVSLSLDEIEHGILRRSKQKLALGYISKLRTSDFEQQVRVEEIDFRIHFALNCGANSCPPIFMFSAKDIDAELDLVTKQYLEEAICFKNNEDLIKVPRLCLWYLADFGGFSGIREILKQYHLLAPDVAPKIGFLKYDWTTNTNNFAIQ